MRPIRFPLSLLIVFLPILVTYNCGSLEDYSDGQGDSVTTVSGRVVDPYGGGIEGVTVQARGETSYSGCQDPYSYTQSLSRDTLTDSAGFYEFSEENLQEISGSVRIRPLGIYNGSWYTGLSFEPAELSISLSEGDKVILDDFVGTPAYHVTGYITNSTGGVGGVTVELSDGFSTQARTTSSEGYYSFLAPEGTYTIIPVITWNGVPPMPVVDPPSRDAAVYGDDVTGQDFFISYDYY